MKWEEREELNHDYHHRHDVIPQSREGTQRVVILIRPTMSWEAVFLRKEMKVNGAYFSIENQRTLTLQLFEQREREREHLLLTLLFPSSVDRKSGRDSRQDS
jgi:hypothetical protein